MFGEAMSVICADCVEAMRELDEASIDAIVTDPPYGIGFMNKGWDSPEGPEGWGYWAGPVVFETIPLTDTGREQG